MRRLHAAMLPVRSLLTVMMTAALAAVMVAGVAVATNHGSEGDQYTGCLSDKGKIDLVAVGDSPTEPCKASDLQITWNQTGPQGEQGPQGVGFRTDCNDGDIARWNATNVEWECSSALTDLEALLANVSIDGNNLVITGMNLQVVNGTGTTHGAGNGLGNVLIGYNTSDGGDEKTGSHNLVVGDRHTYTSSSGIISGLDNTLSGWYSFVAGGAGNTASGHSSLVGGGQNNTASDNSAFVGGGVANEASGIYSFVGGGRRNHASGVYSFVGGGGDNTASGLYSFVGGGTGDTAGPGICAWIADHNIVTC